MSREGSDGNGSGGGIRRHFSPHAHLARRTWHADSPAAVQHSVWALVGAAFVVAGAIAWMRRPEWPRMLAGGSAVSLLVVLVALWASLVGVVIDVVLVALAVRAGALSRAGGHP